MDDVLPAPLRGANRLRQRHHSPGCLNAEGRREWWGVPGRTLDAVLDHIEIGNVPRLEYPTRAEFLDAATNGAGVVLVVGLRLAGPPPVKPEPEGTPLRRRSRSGALVINKR